jgi:transcriptional regulator with XRE-family HTH domain
MSIVSNNIKYLRRLNGLTQEQFARKIAIKRSLLGAYEEARANPNLTNLKNMAAAFGITVDNLLKNDLRKIRETPDLSLPMSSARPMTVSHSGSVQPPPRVQTFAEPQPLAKIIEKYQQPEPEIRTVSRQVTLKPVSGAAYVPPAFAHQPPKPAVSQFTNSQPAQQTYQPAPAPPLREQESTQLPVFNNSYQSPNHEIQEQRSSNYPVIQWVARNQSNDYVYQYQNPSFLTRLPSFQLPNLPSGYYRAFESGEDFLYPGSLLVGTFVRNWYEIRDGAQYLFVTRNQGIIYRTAFNQVRSRGELTLTSDVAAIPNISVALNEVLEVWEVKAFISLQLPTAIPSFNRVGQLVDELQQELNRIR